MKSQTVLLKYIKYSNGKGKSLAGTGAEGFKSSLLFRPATIAYNLKKLMKWTTKKVQADVKAMQKGLQAAFLDITAIINRQYFVLQPDFLKIYNL